MTAPLAYGAALGAAIAFAAGGGYRRTRLAIAAAYLVFVCAVLAYR